MHSTPKIYIADLRHVADGVIANSSMPLGIGYMKAAMDRDLPDVESRIFTYPDYLLEAMKLDAPDLLGLTKVARHLKVTSQVRQLRERHSELEINCYP